MSIYHIIQQAATIENAHRYEAAQDKLGFCRKVLGGLNGFTDAEIEAWVDELEAEFDCLNGHGMTLQEAQDQAKDEQRAEMANAYALEGVTNY